jgi:hypothetical protein
VMVQPLAELKDPATLMSRTFELLQKHGTGVGADMARKICVKNSILLTLAVMLAKQ